MITLGQAREGETVKISCVECGFGLKRRLCDMGLYDGTKAKVVKNDDRGPVVIQIFNSKLALGRGQANKITVEIL